MDRDRDVNVLKIQQGRVLPASNTVQEQWVYPVKMGVEV
jgi:hypothetical protein